MTTFAVTKSNAASPVIVVDQYAGFSATTDTQDAATRRARLDRLMERRARFGPSLGPTTARIAVAANAVRNFDLSRAIEVLEELRRVGEGMR
jgi:hypothetical protein